MVNKSIHMLIITLGILINAIMPKAWASENFPTKPLTIIVPYSPGSGTDSVIRVVQPMLALALGVPVTVSNRPGAGGSIGTQAIVDAPADGHTIGFSVTATFVTNHFFKKQSYNPMTDFTYLTRIGYFPRMLLVNKDFPGRTHKEFLAQLQQNPSKYFFANIVNSGDMLNAEIYKAATGVKITSIPYGDNANAIMRADLLSNRVQILFSSTAAAVAMINSGQLFPIAITGTTRLPIFPDTPSFSGLGIKNLTTSTWYGFVGPAGILPLRQQKLVQALHQALADPTVNTKMSALGITVSTSSPEEHRNDVITTTKLYSPYVQKLNIIPE